MSKFGIGSAHPGGLPLTKEVMKDEGLNQNSLILDVGCGTGQTSAYLAGEYGSKVIGLEINPIMIEKAKNRMISQQLPVEIIHGSVESIPFQNDSFDYVISESVLAFVNKPKALQEIFRVLKTGGKIIANEFTLNESLGIAEKKEIQEFYGFDSLPMEKDWITLLNETGFRDIKIALDHESILEHTPPSEYKYSSDIEPELFTIMIQHILMTMKYQGIMDVRVFSCIK
ncbi:class I SAM-dependent methyltransferase [Neobacillus sp. D3-1R]|uniref:class I SAM-dependent methyltransferase n=1 Tax=Neobacillus sp. D3-1R TaxID=3445778 RepID=UPI003F9EF7BB